MPARGPHKTPINLKGGNKLRPPSYSLCEAVPEPPDWLSEIAAEKWRKVARELFERGALTTMCLEPLEVYCSTYAEYRELTEFVRKNGRTYQGKGNWEAPRPEVLMATQKSKVFMAVAQQFGFTPGSQSRIAIVPQRDEAAERDPIAAARERLRREQRQNSGQS